MVGEILAAVAVVVMVVVAAVVCQSIVHGGVVCSGGAVGVLAREQKWCQSI